ncbi:MAG TPA: hypothetical protein VFY16_09645 [Gemmatimonadaceae bacterium]|nr:hypothetical protein [Gemmatimonadaceae bacterium]
MRGTGRVKGADSTMTMATVLDVHSRSVVQRARPDGATVLAITDSVRVRGGDPARAAALRQSLRGKRIVLHVSPNGTTRVLDGGRMMNQETRALLAQMPATLPDEPIAVGGSWAQQAAVPLPGESGGSPPGVLSATFRLDSLSDNGDLAYVSMRGTLSRAPGRAGTAPGAMFASTGTVVGAMRIDRRRGFLTAAVATIEVRSVISAPAGSGLPAARIYTRVVQRLESVDKR